MSARSCRECPRVRKAPTFMDSRRTTPARAMALKSVSLPCLPPPPLSSSLTLFLFFPAISILFFASLNTMKRHLAFPFSAFFINHLVRRRLGTFVGANKLKFRLLLPTAESFSFISGPDIRIYYHQLTIHVFVQQPNVEVVIYGILNGILERRLCMFKSFK